MRVWYKESLREVSLDSGINPGQSGASDLSLTEAQNGQPSCFQFQHFLSLIWSILSASQGSLVTQCLTLAPADQWF